MKVKVKFYTHLPDLVGKKEIDEVDCEEGATISTLLDWLFMDLKMKDALFDQEQKIKANITILKNGREIKFLDGLETCINSGDEIAFFPLVVGG
ncbi:MAG: ubiquitin-like small modifier protein 1 [Candidatus Odinarchaeota archaeon]